MATAEAPQPVKCIAGLLAGRAEWLDLATQALADAWGPVDVTSPDWAFEFTDYYAPTMGEGLLRRFVAFERLMDPGELAERKLFTNALEAELSARLAASQPRPVNIDPGYVAPSKLVLASAKNFAHRIYLRDGIYAEVTLQFRGGRWQRLEWTFPDYGSGLYDVFLTEVRDRLRRRS